MQARYPAFWHSGLVPSPTRELSQQLRARAVLCKSAKMEFVRTKSPTSWQAYGRQALRHAPRLSRRGAKFCAEWSQLDFSWRGPPKRGFCGRKDALEALLANGGGLAVKIKDFSSGCEIKASWRPYTTIYSSRSFPSYPVLSLPDPKERKGTPKTSSPKGKSFEKPIPSTPSPRLDLSASSSGKHASTCTLTYTPAFIYISPRAAVTHVRARSALTPSATTSNAVTAALTSSATLPSASALRRFLAMSVDSDSASIIARQLWNLPTETTSQPPLHCTPIILPSNGVLQLGDQSAITLTTNVQFQPECTGTAADQVFSVNNLKDPFYASTIPMVYVIASATVIAWVLVVMLTITPRTNFFGLPNTAATFTSGHGIIGGANGGGTGFSGSGSRPWLQKVAALAVAISLTIATADTLEVAERQYRNGYQDASGLRKEVLVSLEIRIMRVISDVFLWLAQVQTLIRLFPRHKEKVLIKWIGFVLIILDSIFSCLNAFLINSPTHGRKFVDAIPALSYLFELALGLLYAAWVMYFAMTKRRYAFYNAKMRSISLIALLSFIAILTPVVFFVTDVVNQDVAGWGDYFRWVGAAAASVVVWEWVERIEALERDDKKDGILGREIFDGDEMLDVMPGDNDTSWSQSRSLSRNFRRRDAGDTEHGQGAGRTEHGFGIMGNPFRSRHIQSPLHFPLGRAHSASEALSSNDHGGFPNSRSVTFSQPPRPSQQHNAGTLGDPTPPPPVASPVSRTDTTSATSTVYVVRNPVAGVPQPIRRRRPMTRIEHTQPQHQHQRKHTGAGAVVENDWVNSEDDLQPSRHRDARRWHAVSNPFKRKRTSPPQEVQRARAAAPDDTKPAVQVQTALKLNVRSRLGDLTAGTSERLRTKAGTRRQEVNRPVTVVPAQARGSGRTWSPDERAFISMTPAPPQGNANIQDGPSISGAATLTNDQQNLAQSNLQTIGAFSQAGNRTVAAPATSTPSTWSGPPRADDISPSAGRDGSRTVVVPAPRRRTPLDESASSPPRIRASSAGSTML